MMSDFLLTCQNRNDWNLFETSFEKSDKQMALPKFTEFLFCARKTHTHTLSHTHQYTIKASAVFCLCFFSHFHSLFLAMACVMCWVCAYVLFFKWERQMRWEEFHICLFGFLSIIFLARLVSWEKLVTEHMICIYMLTDRVCFIVCVFLFILICSSR